MTKFLEESNSVQNRIEHLEHLLFYNLCVKFLRFVQRNNRAIYNIHFSVDIRMNETIVLCNVDFDKHLHGQYNHIMCDMDYLYK